MALADRRPAHGTHETKYACMDNKHPRLLLANAFPLIVQEYWQWHLQVRTRIIDIHIHASLATNPHPPHHPQNQTQPNQQHTGHPRLLPERRQRPRLPHAPPPPRLGGPALLRPRAGGGPGPPLGVPPPLVACSAAALVRARCRGGVTSPFVGEPDRRDANPFENLDRFKLLIYLRGFHETGPLIRMIYQIVIDTRYFLVVRFWGLFMTAAFLTPQNQPTNQP